MSNVPTRSNAPHEEALPVRGSTVDSARPVRRGRSSAKARAWCFTENSPEDSKFHGAEREGLAAFAPGVRFIVYQLKRGEAEHHDHYQGYIELLTSRPLVWLRNNISSSAHWEIRRGSQDEAIRYCQKADTRVRGPFLFGEASAGAGSRTDLVSFRDAIKEGKKRSDLFEAFPAMMARYPRFYDTFMRTRRPAVTLDFKVILLYGETGIGKTRWVHEHWTNKPGGFWDLPVITSGMWFDGYDGEAYVLFDDFAGAASKVSLTTLLRLLDRYPIQVPVKGSFVWWHPRRIAITTNVHPNQWYKWTGRKSSYLALKRRFTKIYQFMDGQRLNCLPDWMDWEEVDTYNRH